MKRIALYIIFATMFFSGCDMFSTRNPEEPDAAKSTYPPRTSPDIVVSNFVKSITEKNTQQYLENFYDSGASESLYEFVFLPAADGIARYQSIFLNWKFDSERSYLDAIIAKLPEDIYPELVLTNSNFEVLQPDSAVYISDYYLFLNFVDENVEKEFSGTLQFTMVPGNDASWSIYKWLDIQKQDDSVKSTWSILKGQHSN